MKTTLKSVASQLNLSPALVSRVLNDKPGVWASEETRRRIREVAEELAYHPSASARALATGKSMQIALLIDADGQQSSEMARSPDIHGLLDAAAAHGYRVLLLPLEVGEAGERQLQQLAKQKACDGICVISSRFSNRHLQILERYQVPCVIIGDFSPIEWNAESSQAAVRVDHDNYRYAFDSVMWLHERGHNRIAWALGPGEADQPHTCELRRGYSEAMAQIGEEPHIIPQFQQNRQLEDYLRNRDFSAVIVRYLHGVLKWMHHARLAGVRLPEELTILGHLDTAEASPLMLNGWGDQVVLHHYNSRYVSQQAGEILMHWAAGQSPQKRLILIEPQPIG